MIVTLSIDDAIKYGSEVIVATGVIVTAVRNWHLPGKVQDIKVSVDGRLDQLLVKTGELATALERERGEKKASDLATGIAAGENK